ncbi:hypothetical protein [Nocardia yamanashiensis]|uniref:hypothetical protein n=1 Tax=Nocardia yamanashiensis TaxID=209247 RepID=UPI001F45141A|nr:hypothetical protein [Nocardia yamanashiensis]
MPSATGIDLPAEIDGTAAADEGLVEVVGFGVVAAEAEGATAAASDAPPPLGQAVDA